MACAGTNQARSWDSRVWAKPLSLAYTGHQAQEVHEYLANGKEGEINEKRPAARS